MEQPELSLFLIKYLMTLVVGISAVFWVSSKKTCSEWASFFKRNRKKDPISESRRVLQESCEFFLKHNSRAQHKSSSHKLKVVSKSMGTSTGMHTPVTGNHGNTPVSTAIHNHCIPSQSISDPHRSSETSAQERIGSAAAAERRSKADSSSRVSSHTQTSHRLRPKDDSLGTDQSSAHCTNTQ